MDENINMEGQVDEALADESQSSLDNSLELDDSVVDEADANDKRKCKDCSCKEMEDEDGDCDDGNCDTDDEDDDDLEEGHTKAKSSYADALKRALENKKPARKLAHEKSLKRRELRGGKILAQNILSAKKHSKSVNKLGFGKQQVHLYSSENIDDMNTCEHIVDTDKLSKVLADSANIRFDTIKESLLEAFDRMEFMKSLNESDAVQLSESVVNTVCDYVEEAAINIARDLIDEAEDYTSNVIVPSVAEIADDYARDIVVPELTESADKYLDYVVNETIDELMQNKLVVKSRAAMQSEQFQEKLLNLISEELRIVPEQEDAVEHLEEEVSYYKSMLDSERMEKNKSRRELEEARKAMYVLTHIPEGISDAGRDSIMESISNIDAVEYNIFKRKVDDVISDYEDEISESNGNGYSFNAVRSNETRANDVDSGNTHNDIIHSIINESLGLLKR